MSLIGKTIISEWNMVCDRLYLSSVVESCFLAGAGLGSVTSGWISDQYGRKNTLMTFASVQLVTGKLLQNYVSASRERWEFAIAQKSNGFVICETS